MIKPTRPVKKQFDELGLNFYLIDATEGRVLFSLQGSDEIGPALRHVSTGNRAGEPLATGPGERRTSIADFQAYAPREVRSALYCQDIRNSIGRFWCHGAHITDQQVTRAVDSRKGNGADGESYLLGVSQ
jgi:hypothetical protein